MTCPYEEDICSGAGVANELSFALGTDTPVQHTITALTGLKSCSYKITATSGAPGFQLNNNAAVVTTTVASWVEYDLLDSNFVSFDGATSTWPTVTTPSAYLDCGTQCTPGELVARVASGANVSAYIILQALQAKRAEYEQYTAEATTVATYNAALYAPSLWDVIVGVQVAIAQPMPTRPVAYQGIIFKLATDDVAAPAGQTLSTGQGGYGEITSGTTTDTRAGSALTGDGPFGYQPYGALGKGTSSTLSVDLDTADKSRLMLVSVWNTDPTWTQSAANQAIKLDMGAYAFNPIDFSTPTVPDAPTVEQGASQLVFAAAISLASLALY